MCTLLADVLPSRGEIDRLYEGHTPVHLWRALNTKKSQMPFEFVEERHRMSNGRIRPADITIENRNGTKWVLVTERPRGLSTFDRPGLPKGRDWEYYKIPKGTRLPPGLAIVRDGKNEHLGAVHYTIAPDRDMPLAQFKSLLSQLALSLVKEAI